MFTVCPATLTRTQVVLKKKLCMFWRQDRQAEKHSLYVVLRLLELQIGIHASGVWIGTMLPCIISWFDMRVGVRKLFHCIIFRACCAFRAKYEFNFFFVRMSALCVYVSVFLYLLEVHIVSAFKIILFFFFFCHKKYAIPNLFPEGVRLPHDCEMEKTTERFLTPCLTLKKRFQIFFSFFLVLFFLP